MNDHDIQGPPVEPARPRLLDLARETIFQIRRNGNVARILSCAGVSIRKGSRLESQYPYGFQGDVR